MGRAAIVRVGFDGGLVVARGRVDRMARLYGLACSKYPSMLLILHVPLFVATRRDELAVENKEKYQFPEEPNLGSQGRLYRSCNYLAISPSKSATNTRDYQGRTTILAGAYDMPVKLATSPAFNFAIPSP